MRSNRSRLLASTIFAGAVLVSQPALAQDTDEPVDIATQDTGTQEDEEPALVVTGSRLRGTFVSDAPVDVLTREEALLSGARSAAEVLQSPTVTSGGAQINQTFLGYVSQGGAGANTVGLRGLGAERTLILLNGRRLAPAGAGPELTAVDLNVLPTSLIQRYEILREGASSIYGSDAIAGVINIITDTKVDGITLDAYTDQPIQHGGGPRTYRLSAIAGKSWEGGHLTASFEFRENTGMRFSDRSDDSNFTCPTDGYFDLQTGEPRGQLTPDRSALRCFPFQNGAVGTATNYLLGFGYQGLGVNRYSYRNGDINDPVNVNNEDFRPEASPREREAFLYTPIQTLTGYLNGAVNLSDNVELYGEALYSRRRSHQLNTSQISIDPDQLGSEIYGGTYGGVPFGQAFPSVASAVSPFFPTSLAAIGANVLRVFIVPPILNNTQEVNFFRGNFGVRGDLGVGDWRFDLNGMYSRTESEYMTQNIDTRRFQEALDIVAAPAGTPDSIAVVAGPGTEGAGGRYTCRSNLSGGAYVAGRNCIAADLFNPAALSGNLDPRLVDWLYGEEVGNTTFEQITAQFVVDGTLFDLPGGPLAVALGAEFRQDEINDVPSEAAQTRNLYNYSSATITAGRDRVYEVFGELNAPLLKDKPFFRDLSVSASGRFTNYESYGSGFTYRLGMNWAPVEMLRFRGSYGTSFRAPNLYEQFVGDQSGFPAYDPCEDFSANYVATDNVYKNCLADITEALIRGGATPTQANAAALAYVAPSTPEQFTRGGAGNLEAEKSTSWGLGGVLTLPRSIADVSFAVDYFNIDVRDEVNLLGTNILDRCYESDEFRAGNFYCTLIDPREDVQGTLTGYLNPYLNIASQKAEGIDFSARYSGRIGPGMLTANARVTKMLRQYFQQLAESEGFDYNGELGNQGTVGGPEWTGSFDVRYDVEEVTFRWGVDYVGPMETEAPAANIRVTGGAQGTLEEVGFDLRAEAYWEHNASIRFKVQDVGQVTFGVSNVFNQKPSKISTHPNASYSYPRVGNYFNYSGYDFVGRSIFMSLTTSFK